MGEKIQQFSGIDLKKVAMAVFPSFFTVYFLMFAQVFVSSSVQAVCLALTTGLFVLIVQIGRVNIVLWGETKKM